jgi:hypothetical protein
MSIWERIRQFWRPGRGPDHPLTEEERDEDRPASAYDERARTTEDFVGDDFDPDAQPPVRHRP